MIVILPLAVAGLALLFWPEIAAAGHAALQRTIDYIPLIRELPKKHQKWRHSKMHLKARLKKLENGEKQNLISRTYSAMEKTMAITGNQNRIRTVRIISLCCGGGGLLLALLLQSWVLAPILGVGLFLLPLWFTRLRLFRFRFSQMNELSVALSMITSSYLRTENTLMAVEENLSYLHGTVKREFAQFLNTSKNINPDIPANLTRLSKSIDNKTFRLWCQLMILCQADINQKYSLSAVVDQFSQDKDVYNELAATITQPVKEFVLISLISLGAFPLSFLIGTSFGVPDMAYILFRSLAGQAIIVGYVIVLLLGINKSIRLSTDLA